MSDKFCDWAALTPSKEALESFGQEASGAPDPARTLWRVAKHLVPSGNRTTTFALSASAGQLSASRLTALASSERPLCSDWMRRSVGLSASVDALENTNLLSMLGIHVQFLGRPARSLVTTISAPSQIPMRHACIA